MTWRMKVGGGVGDFAMQLEVGGDDEPLAIVGPNGSGKTTLLRMIAGAHRPDRGLIEVAGRTFFDAHDERNLPIEERRVGYVPQGYALFDHLTARENVAFGLSSSHHRHPRDERHRRATAMLEQMDCGDLADRYPRQLSGGEKQKVALARALVIEPRMLLLDEPLAAVDASARRQLRRLLADRLDDLAGPSVVATHDVRDVAALDAAVCVLDDGRVVQRGSLSDLRDAPANAFVAEFVGAAP